MSRAAPRCGHRACNNRRSAGRIFCRACWACVSHGLRARIARAEERRDPRALTEAVIEACQQITSRRADRRPVPAPPRIGPREAYARTAAMLGEHDEQESAE